MMQDQPKPIAQEFYEESTLRVEQYLKNRYDLQPCAPSDEDFPKNVTKNDGVAWKIKVENELYPLTYIIFIPNIFPDKLPKIYLTKKDYNKLMPIPHVDINRFVCTRDPHVVYINEDKPGEAVDELVKIATNEIINKGIKKENIDDFNEEFIAYWNNDAILSTLSLFSPGEKIEKLIIAYFEKNFLNSNFILSNSVKESEKWLAPFKIKIEEDSIYEALHIPLKSPIFPPFKNIDLLNILKESGVFDVSEVKQYLNLRNENLFVFISLPLKEDRILAGWQQTNPSKVNGFRPNKIPLNIKLSRATIIRIRVERLDKGRLFKRGGTGVSSSIDDKSIAIIGCGSIGGSLAVSLSKTGISKFLLADNEKLESDNIARHVCGFKEAGQRLHKSVAS